MARQASRLDYAARRLRRVGTGASPAGRTAVLLALATLIGFAIVLHMVRSQHTAALDLRVTRWLQRAPGPVVPVVLTAVTWVGWQPQQALIAGGVLTLFYRTRRWAEGAFLLLALFVGALNDLLKLVLRRPRPSAALDDIVVHGHVLGTSFPSGHVLTYVLFYGFLVYIACTQVRRPLVRRAALAPMLALLLLIGPSRIYLGHHWFTDTVAAYLLGGALLTGLLLAYRWANARQAVQARTRETVACGADIPPAGNRPI